MQKKVLILYSKLSNYMLNVFEKWTYASKVEIHIVHYETNVSEAPYEHNTALNNIYFYPYNETTYKDISNIANSINPDVIICSGWASFKYLRLVFSFYKSVPLILTVDNYWLNTFRQKIATLLFPSTISRLFSYVWVPGKPQEEYVKRLGFKDSQIRLGFYTANREIFEAKQLNCNSKFNKEFYFVGRYIPGKGVLDLEIAFIEIQNEFPNEWKLNCIGRGPLVEKMCNHPKINHIGFVQPIDLRKYTSKGGVFILPSHFEPWGLVVHEFSMAGFPLIVSDAVGSADQFVVNGKNGYIFQSKSIDALKDSMLKIIYSSNEKLFDMSKNSIKQSRLIDEATWIKTIDDILSSGKS